jgi:hypothetical protein
MLVSFICISENRTSMFNQEEKIMNVYLKIVMVEFLRLLMICMTVDYLVILILIVAIIKSQRYGSYISMFFHIFIILFVGINSFFLFRSSGYSKYLVENFETVSWLCFDNMSTVITR